LFPPLCLVLMWRFRAPSEAYTLEHGSNGHLKSLSSSAVVFLTWIFLYPGPYLYGLKLWRLFT
jgi:hypothetical protein